MRYKVTCWVEQQQNELPDYFEHFFVEANSKEEAEAKAKVFQRRAYSIKVSKWIENPLLNKETVVVSNYGYENINMKEATE
jgi:hypothetical protein